MSQSKPDCTLEEFFNYIYHLTEESDRRYPEANYNVCKLMISKLTTAISAIELLESAKKYGFSEAETIHNLSAIHQAMSELLSQWKELYDIKANVPARPDFSRYKCSINHSGKKGRPSYEINIETVRNLKSFSFKWTEIAELIGIHRSTLWRILSEKYPEDLANKYSEISDNDLDSVIREIKKEHPLAGERIIIGILRSQGKHLQRYRIRNSIHRVDPINTAMRWLRKNPRWVYSVAGPNALWHNDGLHKLIHWKFVVHGCIDGFSRMITYLVCASNNNADTVLTAFLEAASKYGTPARVRGDHGGENVRLADFMRRTRNSRSGYIQGPSVHNQRIERLHYDTTHCVLSHYISLFLFLEENEILDRCNDIDLFCLHQVYLSRIQQSLDRFSEGWNHHQLSTEKNKSPYQIFTTGMMNRHFQNQTGVKKYFENEVTEQNIDDMYGVDVTSCSSEYLNDDVIEIDEIEVSAEMNEIAASFDLQTDDGNFGINHYISLKHELTK